MTLSQNADTQSATNPITVARFEKPCSRNAIAPLASSDRIGPSASAIGCSLSPMPAASSSIFVRSGSDARHTKFMASPMPSRSPPSVLNTALPSGSSAALALVLSSSHCSVQSAVAW